MLGLNSSSSSPSAPYPLPLLKELCHMIIQLLYNVSQVGKSPNAVPNIKLINVIIVYYYIAQFNENVQKPNNHYFPSTFVTGILYHHLNFIILFLLIIYSFLFSYGY